MLSGFPVYMIGEPFLKKSGSHSEKDGLVLSKKEGGERALDKSAKKSVAHTCENTRRLRNM